MLTTTTLRLDQELLDQVTALAERDHQSKNSLMTELIADGIRTRALADEMRNKEVREIIDQELIKWAPALERLADL